MEITKDTILSDILKISGAEKILAKYNLPCLWCPAASFEVEKLKIGDVCQTYNIDFGKLLKELNRVAQGKNF